MAGRHLERTSFAETNAGALAAGITQKILPRCNSATRLFRRTVTPLTGIATVLLAAPSFGSSATAGSVSALIAKQDSAFFTRSGRGPPCLSYAGAASSDQWQRGWADANRVSAVAAGAGQADHSDRRRDLFKLGRYGNGRVYPAGELNGRLASFGFVVDPGLDWSMP